MLLVCGFCKKKFTATAAQERRARWPSTQYKNGFMCSKSCLSALGVASRKAKNKLPLRKLAYSRLNSAVESGKLIRPLHCECCGRKPKKDKLGRSRIEGHHPDHNKPLEVVWLCDVCHREITPRAKGERNGASRLTTIEVKQIKKDLENNNAYQISKMYGVTPKTIYDIRDRKNWGHV